MEKFDPNTLLPFNRVLVRDAIEQNWVCSTFLHITGRDEFSFSCVGGCYRICIPYNEHTKHLVGTNDDAPEYYRYWEKY